MGAFSRLSALSFIVAAVTTLIATAGCGHLVNNPAIAYSYLVYSDPQLVSHWAMNELTGTTAADTTSGNNGTYMNGFNLGEPGPLFGWANYSVGFNNGYINVPYSETMHLTNALSIEAWMRVDPADTQPAWAKVMWMGGNGSYCAGQGPWGFELQGATDSMTFHVAVDTTGLDEPRDIKATLDHNVKNLIDNEWHHIVGVFDSTGTTNDDVIRLYVDGEPMTLVFTEYTAGGGPFAVAAGDLVGGIIPDSAYDAYSGSAAPSAAGGATCDGFRTATPIGLKIAAASQANGIGVTQGFIGDFASMAFYNGAISDAAARSHYNQGKFGHP